jgi:ATP synthase subunit 6
MTFFSFFNVSPVEQFAILPLLPLFNLISINNVFVLIFIILCFLILSLFVLCKRFSFKNSSGLYIIPTRYQTIFEFIFKGAMGLVKDNVNSLTAQYFFPLVATLFLFLLCSNLFGLVPYSYTITSHLIVTFALSLYLFIGINIICFKKNKLQSFGLFLPNGTGTALAFLLVPIEFISYIFKPISLSIRLFANMMAGHTLLKVIAGFSWTLVAVGNFIFVLMHLVPTLILIPLFFLESAVAVIQSFVFTVLICIYINDALNLH